MNHSRHSSLPRPLSSSGVVFGSLNRPPPHSQAAERDWEEKRASLTQYSAQDINRLLEETQAELMKAIPDLDFAAKQIKPSANTPSSQMHQGGGGTLEHRVSKPQHKLSAKEGGSRRGSGKLSVLRVLSTKLFEVSDLGLQRSSRVCVVLQKKKQLYRSPENSVLTPRASGWKRL